MKAFLQNPSKDNVLLNGAVEKFGVMPAMQFPEEEIEAIALYMYHNKLTKPEWFDEHFKEQGLPLRYQTNTTIAYVITVQGPQTVETAFVPLDYDHYIEKQIKPIAESILPLISLNFEQIANDQLTLF